MTACRPCDGHNLPGSRLTGVVGPSSIPLERQSRCSMEISTASPQSIPLAHHSSIASGFSGNPKCAGWGNSWGVRPRGPPWLHGLRRSCGLHSPPRRFYSALALPPAVTDERTITRAPGKAGPLWRAQRPDVGVSGGPSGIRTQDRRIKSQWLQPQNSGKIAE